MRVGDFGLEVSAGQGNDIREIESGHVLARPGAVYALRLRNFGPLRCVAQVEIDGKPVTAGGLVLDPYSVCTLERPVDAIETGRFTVVAEGDERVFGPDGGRDNADLGLIEARFRRELPEARDRSYPRALPDTPTLPFPPAPPIPTPPGRPMVPPEWSPPGWQANAYESTPDVSAIASHLTSHPARPSNDRVAETIERAAGTGLTGHSSQEFVPTFVGTLEKEATTLRLRLVIGTDEALVAPRPLPERDDAPARPAARP